jgi:hypothetical protein
VAVVANAEGAARGALGGYQTGREHAALAVMALTQLGAPWPVPVYFSVDWDMGPADEESVALYFQGIRDVIPLQYVGIYGGLHAVRWAQLLGIARWFWQTYAWSHGVWADKLHIRQVRNGVQLAGGEVDLDQLVQVSVGQWTLSGSTLDNEGDAELDSMQAAQLAEIHERIMNINASLYTQAGTEGIPAYPAAHRFGAGGESAAIVDQLAYLCDSLGSVLDQLTTFAADLRTLTERDGVDTAALAHALSAQPEIASGLATQLAQHLGTLRGTLTLSGQLDGSVGQAPTGP